MMHSEEIPQLAENTRLFYIGPMKTGTTTVQEAAHIARAELYDLGVYYPGKTRNHRRAINAIVSGPDLADDNRSNGSERYSVGERQTSSASSGDNDWVSLLKDIDNEPSRRVLVSHEFASSASHDQAKTFYQELGPDHTHIVITLRPFAAMLVSHWAQSLKTASSRTFNDWLDDVFHKPKAMISQHLKYQLDVASLVERWVGVAGRENVTVIVADYEDKELTTDTFERLLGLPKHTLTGIVSGGRQTNRSLTESESELIRRLNALVSEHAGVSRKVYSNVIPHGAISRILDQRSPGSSESTIRLPQWAIDKSLVIAKQYADRISATGVRVVGDLTNLHMPPQADDSAQSSADYIPYNIAVEALAGALYGAGRYESRLLKRISRAETEMVQEWPKLTRSEDTLGITETKTYTAVRTQSGDAKTKDDIAKSFTTRNLLGALCVRLSYKFRNGKSMPLE